MRGTDRNFLKARWYLIPAAAIFLLLFSWFLFRAEFYVFMIYRGRGEWASSHLAKMNSLERDFFEKHLQSPKWHVRCSILRTLRKMDNEALAVPILLEHAKEEKDGTCQLELAVALLKHGQYDEAKPILYALRADEKWGKAAEQILLKIPEKSLDAAPPQPTAE